MCNNLRHMVNDEKKVFYYMIIEEFVVIYRGIENIKLKINE